MEKKSLNIKGKTATASKKVPSRKASIKATKIAPKTGSTGGWGRLALNHNETLLLA